MSRHCSASEATSTCDGSVGGVQRKVSSTFASVDFGLAASLPKTASLLQDSCGFFPAFSERTRMPLISLPKARSEGERHSAGKLDLAGSFAEAVQAKMDAMTRTGKPTLLCMAIALCKWGRSGRMDSFG